MPGRSSTQTVSVSSVQVAASADRTSPERSSPRAWQFGAALGVGCRRQQQLAQRLAYVVEQLVQLGAAAFDIVVLEPRTQGPVVVAGRLARAQERFRVLVARRGMLGGSSFAAGQDRVKPRHQPRRIDRKVLDHHAGAAEERDAVVECLGGERLLARLGESHDEVAFGELIRALLVGAPPWKMDLDSPGRDVSGLFKARTGATALLPGRHERRDRFGDGDRLAADEDPEGTWEVHGWPEELGGAAADEIEERWQLVSSLARRIAEADHEDRRAGRFGRTGYSQSLGQVERLLCPERDGAFAVLDLLGFSEPSGAHVVRAVDGVTRQLDAADQAVPPRAAALVQARVEDHRRVG